MERILLKINLETIAKNIGILQKIVAPAKIIPVLKADAYGLGLEPISRYLCGKNIKRLAIANAKEAKILRRCCPKAIIYHIGACFEQEIETLIENDIIISVDHSKMLKKIVTAATKAQKKVNVQILFDTGMGRLGIPFAQSEEEWKKIAHILHKEKKKIALKAVYSHLANADKKNDDYTLQQIKKYKKIKEMVTKTMASPKEKIDFHLSNSSGLMHYGDASFDFARVGIGLYSGYGGNHNSDSSTTKTSIPATKMCCELCSSIVSVRRLAKGESIGYHCQYTLKNTSTVATIAAGYGDGIPMPLSGEKAVMIKKEKVLIIGKISMDYTTVLIPRHMEVKVGDKAVFLGEQGDKKITIEDWARYKKTNPQEILTSLAQRVKRKYIPQTFV